MNLAYTPALPRLAEQAEGAISNRYKGRTISADGAQHPDFIEQWQNLVKNACEPNPFFEPWFLLPSLSAFAPANHNISLFALYKRDTLVGLMPIELGTNYYGYRLPHIATWLHANAFYGAPLVRRNYEHVFWAALLDHLNQRTRFSLFLHLPLLEADGPLNIALTKVITQSNGYSAEVHRIKRAMLASDLSSEDYLSTTLCKKHRKELARQRRRLAEHGAIEFVRSVDESGIDQWIEEFLDIEAAGWKGKAGSALASTRQCRSFFTETLKRAAKAGRLERRSLRLDGKPIGMLASFITAPGCYSFKTAFDENYASYSPGMQLQVENLASLQDPSIAWTDSCAAEGHPMIDRLWMERRTLISRNIAVGGGVRRAIFRQLMNYETRRSRT